MRGDPKKWNLFKKLCIYSYMFKWQSPSKYLPFDTIHLLRHFFHCSKQFLNWWIFFSMFKNCIFIFKITLLLFNYSGLHFLPPSPPPQPSPPPSPVSIRPCYCPCVLYNCSCKPFTLFPHYPLPSPFWLLSAHSQFQCLWLYFDCLFHLLIRFQLKVRSHGICLSMPGFFHLA